MAEVVLEIEVTADGQMTTLATGSGFGSDKGAKSGMTQDQLAAIIVHERIVGSIEGKVAPNAPKNGDSNVVNDIKIMMAKEDTAKAVQKEVVLPSPVVEQQRAKMGDFIKSNDPKSKP